MMDAAREYKNLDPRIEFKASWLLRLAAVMSFAGSLVISIMGVWTFVLIFQGLWSKPSLVVGIGLAVTTAVATDVVRRLGVAMNDLWREYTLTDQGVEVRDWKGRALENLDWSQMSSCQYDKIGRSLICRFVSKKRVIRLINPDVYGRLDRLASAAETIRRRSEITLKGADLLGHFRTS